MSCEVLARRLTFGVKSNPLVKLSVRNLVLKGSRNGYRHTSSGCHGAQDRMPDFLLPAFTMRVNTALISCQGHRRPPERLWMQSACKFSASSTAQAVVVTANPRTDDDGNEMVIDITARAANVSQSYLSSWSSVSSDACW